MQKNVYNQISIPEWKEVVFIHKRLKDGVPLEFATERSLVRVYSEAFVQNLVQAVFASIGDSGHYM